MNQRGFLFLILFLVISFPGYAASKKGDAAIKGAGISSCKQFVETVKNKGNVAIYAGWMDGFITAANINEKNTFDFTPWQSTNTLLEGIYGYCNKHPDLNYFNATSEMLKALYKKRVVEDAKIIKVNIEGKSLYIYDEVIKRIQMQLAELKLYSGKVSGKYDDRTQKAVKEFQKKNKLAETGIPDQKTLIYLLKPV